VRGAKNASGNIAYEGWHFAPMPDMTGTIFYIVSKTLSKDTDRFMLFWLQIQVAWSDQANDVIKSHSKHRLIMLPAS
jgi:hypothetical protein